MSKKTFRLENGKEVTAGLNIFRAYQSKRNKERYLERKRNEFVVRSIDDEQAAYDLKSDVDDWNSFAMLCMIYPRKNSSLSKNTSLRICL